MKMDGEQKRRVMQVLRVAESRGDYGTALLWGHPGYSSARLASGVLSCGAAGVTGVSSLSSPQLCECWLTGSVSRRAGRGFCALFA